MKGSDRIAPNPKPGKYGRILFIFLLFSLIPLLLELDRVGFIEDEGIRGLVALEMELSGNYITPTLNGDPYYKKPPLWNWILVASHKILGASIFSSRLPTVFFLLLSCGAIFLGFRRHFGEEQAMISALLYLTCGRILFWDSMLALIDICFSFVMFVMFLWIYEKGQKKQFYKLYMGAYLLAAAGFMLKALPALVFLGFSILGYLLYTKQWRKLISLEHVAGFSLFALIIGGYLLVYSQYLPVEQLLKTWFVESSQRTAANHSIWESVQHLFAFPFEMVYHFLPWSILLIFLLWKRNWLLLKAQPMAVYCLVIFAVNIWVYWTSPNVFPRYVLMLFPMLYAPCIFLYFHEANQTIRKHFDTFFLVATILVVPTLWVAPFVPDTAAIPNLIIKLLGITVLFAGLLFFMIKNRRWRLLHFCISIMIVRLAFDIIILPTRADNDWIHYVRIDAERIGKQYRDEELKIYKLDHLRFETGFYLTRERNRILESTDEVTPGTKLLVHPGWHPEILDKYPVIDSMRIQWPPEKVYIIDINE